jgi:uncharacterized protein (TIGR03663 family)
LAKLPPKLRLLFLGIALLALVVRLPHLSQRPMHTDEAVNAYITGQLIAGQKYHYDPRDRHGPALYVFAFPVARIAGAKQFPDLTEVTVRLAPVIIGALMILLFMSAAREYGFIAAGIAAVLFAIGPMPVYYSRYFIHETLFVAATLGLIVSGWRMLTTRLVEPGVAAGFFAGLMLACKETAVLHFAALGVAGLAGFFMLRKHRPEPLPFEFVRPLTLTPTLVGALVAFTAVVIISYSWLGTNWRGVTDLIRSLPLFVSRAGGQGHEKPFDYYLMLLAGGKSGAAVLALALLGGLGVVVRLERRRARAIPGAPLSVPSAWPAPTGLTLSQSPAGKKESASGTQQDASVPPYPNLPSASSESWEMQQEKEQRKEQEEKNRKQMSAERQAFGVLLIYTLAIAVIYSAIPYKTPWLALNLWLPLTLLAGFGGSLLWRHCKPVVLRAILVAAGGALIYALGFDTWQRAFAKPADAQNPYAYAHTSEGLLELPSRIAALAAQSPMRNNFKITVIAADPWPLPWYLRKFPQAGYWQPGQKEPAPAEILITSTEVGDRLGMQLKNWRPEFFEQRPGVLLQLWTPPEKEAAP